MLGKKVNALLEKQKIGLLKLHGVKEDGMINPDAFRNYKGFTDPLTGKTKPALEVILENCIGWLNGPDARKVLYEEIPLLEQSINEATLTTDFATFTTSMLPFVTRIIAKSIMLRYMSVQPIKGPTAEIFYRNPKYSDTYEADSVTAEDRVDARDDVDGYAVSSEAGTIRKMQRSLDHKSISTIIMKLIAEWTLESQHLAQGQFGIDMESELAADITGEIIRETDVRILNALIAGVGYDVEWNLSDYLGESAGHTADVLAYQQTLYQSIMAVNSHILQYKRVNGGVIVVHPATFYYLSRLNTFQSNPFPENMESESWFTVAGKLTPGFDIIISNAMTQNKLLVFHKPDGWKRAVGYYCPFVPLYLSNNYVRSDDFSQLAKGAYSQFAYGLLPDEHDGSTNQGVCTVSIVSS